MPSTPPTKQQLQRAFIEFIELLRKSLWEKTVGNTGIFAIPKRKLNEIEFLDLDEWTLELISAGVLTEVEDGHPYKLDRQDYKFNSLMTPAEISDYELTLNKEGIIIHVRPSGSKYEMSLNGHPEKMVHLSAEEANFLDFLVKMEDKQLKLEDILEKVQKPNGDPYTNPDQISLLSSYIREKLADIGLGKVEAHKIWPPYFKGDGSIFNRERKYIFSINI